MAEKVRYSDNEVYSNFGMVVFIRGLPGVGKTSLSLLIRDSISTGRVEHIDPDLVDKNEANYIFFCENLAVNCPDLSPAVYLYRYLLNRAKDFFSQGKLVIWSQPFSDTDSLVYTLDQFRDLGLCPSEYDNILVVDLLADREVAREWMHKRLKEGGHGPDDQYFNKLADQFRLANNLNCNYLSIEMGFGFEGPLQMILEKVRRYV